MVACGDPLQRDPNIILIMTDDQGWFDAGFNGNDSIRTPYLDSLAGMGVIFDRFYSASAVCSPTRASVLTGRNPLRMNIPTANVGHLPAEELTLPELLKDRGYQTGHFGKWHLGTFTRTEPDANRGGKEKFLSDYTIPTEHGYDTFFCTESKVPTYDPMVHPNEYRPDESWRYGWKAIEGGQPSTPYGTSYWKAEHTRESENLEGDDSRIIMDRVIPFINSSHEVGDPFFATIWLHTPHLPVVADSLHRSLFAEMDLQTQLYYGTIAAMDEQIGRLWTNLREKGVAENTMIFFCSDNGPERETPGLSGPFRERKRSLYEGGIRVPAFALWPKKFQKGIRIDAPSVTSDYLPTILDALDINYPATHPIDGVSLVPLLTGVSNERVEPIGFLLGTQTSWVTSQYKLIRTKEGKEFELYDLINDRREQFNVISDYPIVAEKMQDKLRQWLQSVEQSKKGEDYK